MSQTSSATRFGSTNSAKVLGIFFVPISNMAHLQLELMENDSKMTD
jgi:hypothetical protein